MMLRWSWIRALSFLAGDRHVDPRRWRLPLAMLGLALLAGCAAKTEGMTPRAMIEEGARLRYGLERPLDRPLSCEMFRRAAEAGDGEGAELIGDCFATGQGRPRNYAQAMDWYQRAATAGQSSALCSLGNFYVMGLSVPEDVPRGVAMCRQAAEAGAASAQARLGSFYLTGKGVPQSFADARLWFTKAADQGSGVAAASLAVMASKGDGGPKDEEAALGWWRLAASKYNPRGMLYLVAYYGKLGMVSSGDSLLLKPSYTVEASYWALTAARFLNDDPDIPPEGRAMVVGASRMVTALPDWRGLIAARVKAGPKAPPPADSEPVAIVKSPVQRT